MNIAKVFLTCSAALIAAMLLPLTGSVQAADEDRLISRKDIFGNPATAAVQRALSKQSFVSAFDPRPPCTRLWQVAKGFPGGAVARVDRMDSDLHQYSSRLGRGGCRAIEFNEQYRRANLGDNRSRIRVIRFGFAPCPPRPSRSSSSPA
jgi:hypothetical protein